MTQADLSALLARVEGAAWAFGYLFQEVYRVAMAFAPDEDGDFSTRFWKLVDVGAWEQAALALVERKLPGVDIIMGRTDGKWRADLLHLPDGDFAGFSSSNLALALLAALLRSLEEGR